MKVELKWITPEADLMIAHMARVSNPMAEPDDPADKLIRYLLEHKHYSPFEMACACLEITTTRDISRQILRHRSFHFQEFSQRYAVVLDDFEFSRHPRLQDRKNRQNSIPVNDPALTYIWSDLQAKVAKASRLAYDHALRVGIAKELARKLLPEGLTPTRMYMQGTMRDWLFYMSVRTDPATQLEHQQVARLAELVFLKHCPQIMEAAYDAGIITDPFQTNR